MMTPRAPALSALALAPLAALAAAAACTESEGPAGPSIISSVERKEIPLALNRKIDILFVIDNSPAAAPHRAKLIDGYRRAIASLESLYGGVPDLHLGVITTDVGTRGTNDANPGPALGSGPGACTSDGDRGELRRAPSISGPFLTDHGLPNGSRERNYTGTLADAFVELADVGSTGCAYARPLDAMRRALGGNPANAGFLRANSFLVVVLLTGDDDCSFGSSSFTGGVLDHGRCVSNAAALTPTSEYVPFLRSLVADPQRVLVLGAFAPPGGPACADTRPATRLAAFFDGFPNRGIATSICAPDLRDLMAPIGALQKYVLPSPCFEATVLDTDPATPGTQADCAAWYSYLDRGNPVEETVPACRGDARGPCWEIRKDPINCTNNSDTAFFRDQRMTFDETTNARVFIECVTQ